MKTHHDNTRIQDYIRMHQIDHMFCSIALLNLQIRTYEPDETILSEGEVLDGIYIQVEGQSRVSSSLETGKTLLLRFCHPVSIFGDIELIQQITVQSRVEAVETSSFLFIPIRDVQQHLMADPLFLNELLRHLAYKLQTCTTASRVNLLSSVEERFATYLLSTGHPKDFGKELHTTHTAEIAAIVGTTPRHINRLVHKLSEQGVIAKSKNGIQILDLEELDRISNGVRYD
ncbi:Crp/Fnr family transcriptional regulator [Paenibacillus sp. N1-5-1-14]|uniref:Crp/Fnr family transcriptional regulator n=1 Tax=Paenibacillus radicibacter TaxID=2972488 RepID=UPI0021592840|nr:Crp/Fnr family transcriptional regulator [Paenibacillus radicibacter]MCR8641027.1 Crp/Fnr family transcriptional regulator [Paenibacillus radicibacter]